MSNFKSAAKRKRELAKLDKRQAKDQKRALKRAERSEATNGAPQVAVPAVAQLSIASARPGTAPVRKPLTFAEAVDRWKNTKIGKPKKR